VTIPSVDEFRQEARRWLSQHAEHRVAGVGRKGWGDGSDRIGVFHRLSWDEERSLIDDLRAWHRLRFDAGFGPISWDVEYGGRALPVSYELAFAEEEADFATPTRHESVNITTHLIAPTIREWGTPEQRARFLRPMLRTDVLWCQLYSEPGAGSDLAGIGTLAGRHGDVWVVNGQKVWTSGARHANWGYLMARTNPDVPKHHGLTAFVLPMDSHGVEVRPLRQMTGGSSFNEVFFTDVQIPDDLRLGGIDEGWRVAMTTLGFERVAASGEGNDLLTRFHRAAALAEHLGRADEPAIRQALSDVYTRARLIEFNNARGRQAIQAGGTPGPEGSIEKLFFSESLRRVSDLVSAVLGPRLVADSGEWGTFAWAEHVTGVPGTRIAGGTDEIQRTIIGERVLGLPAEPRVDRETAFRDLRTQGAVHRTLYTDVHRPGGVVRDAGEAQGPPSRNR
jgi:alkylation response protein AidB-like acyl-CoA dehydrogenase